MGRKCIDISKYRDKAEHQSASISEKSGSIPLNFKHNCNMKHMHGGYTGCIEI